MRYVPDPVKNEFVNIGVMLRPAVKRAGSEARCALPGAGAGSAASTPRPIGGAGSTGSGDPAEAEEES